jgi:hypothetical protein
LEKNDFIEGKNKKIMFEIAMIYKTVHGSVYSKVLGEVLVFAVHFQHCDIVSVHHRRNQKKY